MRVESIRVKLETKDTTLAREIQSRLPIPYKSDIRPGDTLYINYSLNVEYLGECANHLRYLTMLVQQKSDIVDATFEEFEHGQSVIVDFAIAYDKLMRELGKPTYSIKPLPRWNKWLRRWWP